MNQIQCIFYKCSVHVVAQREAHALVKGRNKRKISSEESLAEKVTMRANMAVQPKIIKTPLKNMHTYPKSNTKDCQTVHVPGNAAMWNPKALLYLKLLLMLPKTYHTYTAINIHALTSIPKTPFS